MLNIHRQSEHPGSQWQQQIQRETISTSKACRALLPKKTRKKKENPAHLYWRTWQRVSPLSLQMHCTSGQRKNAYPSTYWLCPLAFQAHSCWWEEKIKVSLRLLPFASVGTAPTPKWEDRAASLHILLFLLFLFLPNSPGPFSCSRCKPVWL